MTHLFYRRILDIRTTLFVMVLTLCQPLAVSSQCPGSLTCEGSNLFCSAGALNGLTCTTPSSPNANFPLFNLCFGSGTPTNLNWWTFVGSGGPLQININYNLASCQLGEGIAAGVFEGSCAGNNVWDCNANCNSSNFTLSGATEPCEVYHLWVDGCESDVCTYTMTFTGNTGPPSIPSPIPPFITDGVICIGGHFYVNAPDFPTSCEPVTEWEVDGVSQGQGSFVMIDVPDTTPEGAVITVCMTATIGDPGDPGRICDQAVRCEDFIIPPIENHFGPCRIVCAEDQPVLWHGQLISQSCISPPCSARVRLRDCSVDSFRSFILLPAPAQGRKDTLICDEFYSYQAEDNRTYQGDICEQMIEFKQQMMHPRCPSHTRRCDTSYLLSIARPTYTTDWELDCAACSGEVTISANVTLENDCQAFMGRLKTQLTWTNENGDMLDITVGTGSITVDQPGRYCAEVEVLLDDTLSCLIIVPECIDVPEALFPDSIDIHGPSRLCEDSIATYFAPLSPDLCDISWQISDNGTIINDTIINDSAMVTISWDTAIQDTGTVCIDLKSDCGTTTSCFLTRICPISTDAYHLDSEPFHLWVFDRTLYWGSQENKDFSIRIMDVNGRMVKSINTNSSYGAALGDLPSGVYLIGHKTSDQNQFHYDTFILP